MSYSRDFLNARIRDDGTTIIVDAKSIDDETGQAGSNDPATEIRVALFKLSDIGQRIVSGPADIPPQAIWSVEFPDAADDFPVDEEVYAFGIAREGNGPPKVWLELMTITTGGGDPPTDGPVDEEAAFPADV